MSSKPIELVVHSSSHPVAFEVEWFPRRPHGMAAGLVLDPPVLSPLFHRHATALTGLTRIELDALCTAEAFLESDADVGPARLVAADRVEGPLDLRRTGGEAIDALLAHASLDRRERALLADGDVAGAALVRGMIEREQAPASLMLRSFLTPPEYVSATRAGTYFEGAGAALDCAGEFRDLEVTQTRLARLNELRAPASIVKDGIGLVYVRTVALFAKAAHTLGRAVVPARGDRLASMQSTEAVLRSLHAATAARMFDSVPEPFAPAVDAEALRAFCQIVAEIRPVWAAPGDARPHGPLQ